VIREENDRRWKYVTIHAGDILNLFLPWEGHHDCFTQLALDPGEFPEGYVIDEVRYNEWAQGWTLLVYHPSFEIVPPAGWPPRAERKARAFYLPRFNSREEAMKAATWMYRTEVDRLREMLAGVVT